MDKIKTEMIVTKECLECGEGIEMCDECTEYFEEYQPIFCVELDDKKIVHWCWNCGKDKEEESKDGIGNKRKEIGKAE